MDSHPCGLPPRIIRMRGDLMELEPLEAARILRTAADYAARHGVKTATIGTPGHPRCAVGCLFSAAPGGDSTSMVLMDALASWCSISCTCRGRQGTGIEGVARLIHFNDYHCGGEGLVATERRTARVVKTFLNAAKRAEAAAAQQRTMTQDATDAAEDQAVAVFKAGVRLRDRAKVVVLTALQAISLFA